MPEPHSDYPTVADLAYGYANPSCPYEISDAAIASFSMMLSPLDLSRLSPALAAEAASCQKAFGDASSQAQACMRAMRASWLRWQQLSSYSSGARSESLPNFAHQSPKSAVVVPPTEQNDPFSSSDALFIKCSHASSASLLLTNEKYVRNVFNRHADRGPPLALTAGALKAALSSVCALHAEGSCAAADAADSVGTDLPLAAPAVLEDFKCAARQFCNDDELGLEDVFLQFADFGGLLSPRALVNAMTDIEVAVFQKAHLAADRILLRADVAQIPAFDFGGFLRVVQLSDDLDAFLHGHSLGVVAPAIRAIVGAGEDDLLKRFAQLGQDELHVAACASVASIHLRLQAVHRQVHDAAIAESKHLEALAKDPGKFSVFKMAAGTIDDFHKGLMDRIGHPNLNFRKGMQSEHLTRGGYDFAFTSSNYDLTTQPCKEWLYIVGDANGQKLECPDSQKQHGRIIHSIEELMQNPLAKMAELKPEEVIAVVMYTGPMFTIYNAVLRRFPADIYEAFKAANNLFPTTIFVLVSAIQKLSRCMDIPAGTLLYRGLGGAMELPDTFFRAATNCKTPNAFGYTEFGFMSTTAEKSVALRYSGVKENKPKASIMRICPNSVDRGADISEFSQYPAEKEFLFVPYSFVQSEGRLQSELAAGGGLVTVIPVRVNINLKTETVEELLYKKKHAHLVTASAMIDEISSELDEWQFSSQAQARLLLDWSRSFRGLTPAALATGIVTQCKAVVRRHEDTAVEDYANDGAFRALVNEILEIKAWAREKKDLWMQDLSRPIDFMQGWSLRECHRMWLSFLQKKIAQAPPGSSEKASRSALVLASKGLVKNAVRDDVNADGEGVLVRAGGDGWSAEDIDAALCAGACVHETDSEERSGVWLAASYGHASSMNALILAGCSVSVSWRRYSVSPVYIASCNGHAACLKFLLDAGGDCNGRNTGGCSPVWTASSYGNAECLALLLAASADFNQCDNQGRSPLYMAAENNRIACVELLLAAGADARCSYKDVSALEACRKKGHRECAELLEAALRDLSVTRTDA